MRLVLDPKFVAHRIDQLISPRFERLVVHTLFVEFFAYGIGEVPDLATSDDPEFHEGVREVSSEALEASEPRLALLETFRWNGSSRR